MSKELFNGNWKFLKLAEGSGFEAFKKAMSDGITPSHVDIPHDWLIYSTQKLYEPSTGFYIKHFVADLTKSTLLEFDGVYMDSEVYVNGERAGNNENGYISFIVDITPYLRDGINEIVVLVRFSPPNSRWYSGAGIYRNVWLIQKQVTSLVPHGCYLSCEKNENNFKLFTQTEVNAPNGAALLQRLVYNEETVLEQAHIIPASSLMQSFSYEYNVKEPSLWDIHSPKLYRFENILSVNGSVVDSDIEPFGFRAIEFSPQNGFLLNGKKVKLNGTCEHHDLGFLGCAFNESAMEHRINILKEMGVNAIRTAHNMPAKELMHLADKHGILIMSEAYDMWRLQKNKNDFARFFDKCHEKDIASWVRRDRNHPSLIMWSIGNEIYDTHIDESGQEISQMLAQQVLKHDPRKNAHTTICSNYMPWENAQKCAEIVKLAGYNYSEKFYDEHHKKHPSYIIYGSETSSVVQSRGVYHFPFEQSVLSDIDMQCSSLGNSTTSWGAKNAEFCIIAERDTPFSCGQFLWSGFDYIGEPTPYHTKNSYFGQIDTAGLPKDSFYLYKAAWTSYKAAPFIHIFPYWDFNEHQTIDVRIASNAPKVELYFNKISLGAQKLEHEHGSHLAAHYKLPYQNGTLTAIAYDESDKEIAREEKKSFGESANISISSSKHTLLANGTDMAFIEISTLDTNGIPVENANDRVMVTVSGAGRLVGLDNGDSTDYEEYKGTSRRLFSGKLVAGIMSGLAAGEICINVSANGLQGDTLTIRTVSTAAPADISANDENKATPTLYPNTAVRKIELTASHREFTAERNKITVQAKLLPHNAKGEIAWEIVDDRGIASNLATLSASGNTATITAKGDGAFRVRCNACNDLPHAAIISQLDFTAKGLGKAFTDPYSLVAGGTYFYTEGTVTNGNEHGFATAREDITVVGFTDLDFRDACSAKITIPIFALKSIPYKLQIWSDVPDSDGAHLLADAIYNKPSKWNTYQEDTFILNRALRGICSIYFRFYDKVHVKGFSFEMQPLAYQRIDVSCVENVYGDSFNKTQASIKGIGNNVTLELGALNFIDNGATRALLCGCSHIEKNTIHLRLESEDGTEQKHVLDFTKSGEHCEKEFTFPKISGKHTVRLVFLPGSNFDFDYIHFLN